MRVFEYPVIKVFILFLFGFLLAYVFPAIKKLILIVSLISLIAVPFIRNNNSFIKNILVTMLVVFVGYQRFSEKFYETELESKILNALLNKKVTLFGEVKRIETNGKNYIQFVLLTDSLKIFNHLFSLSEQLFVNLDFSKSTISQNYFLRIIDIGNTIRISGTLHQPQEAQFLGEFDYRKFLRTKEISYTVSSTQFDDLNLLTVNNSILNYKRYLHRLRNSIGELIDKNFESNVSAYIKGLFIADRSDIPEDIKTSFINSGVIHVLAVSGLHTGYIALILMALFGRFNRFLKFILISLGLFVFVHLANASPSVVRASMMSALVVLNFIIQRNNYLLNSIAIAGLLILFFNPLDILNPGFQLSFAAVFSIAVLYPVINEQFRNLKKNKFVKYILDMFLITLSVSIGTFPFVISYYEKFSVISFIANLIVIPLTGIILGGIILNLITLNLFPSIASIYKIALTELVKFNFEIVEFFGNFPFAYTSIKNFSIYNSLIFLLVIFLLFMILRRNFSPMVKLASGFLLIINYILHFDYFSEKVIDQNKSYLLLTKGISFNSVSIIDPDCKFLSFYKKTDSLSLIASELTRLNKVFDKIEIKKIDIATINTPAIFLNNQIRFKLHQTAVKRVGNEKWFFIKDDFSSEHTSNQSIIGKKYYYFPISNSEILTYDDTRVIITPLIFSEFLKRINQINGNLIYTSPALDTLYYYSGKIQTLMKYSLNFQNRRMLIFQIDSSNIREIKWWED